MKLFLATIGSRGDFEPFLALARELQTGGHEVVLASHDIYAGRAAKFGVPYRTVGPPVELDAMVDIRERLRSMNPLSQLYYLLKHVLLPDAAANYRDVLAHSAGFDLAICHCMDFSAQHALEANGIEWIGVVLTPGTIPSARVPPLEFPNLGRIGNRFLWGVLRLATGPANRRIARALAELDGRRREIRVTGTFAKQLNLVAASPLLGPVPPDRIQNGFLATGFWGMEAGEYRAAGELAEFLEAGKVDVVFTFGSMGGREGARTARIFLDVCEELGLRAIIQRGWGRIEVESEHTNPNVLFLDFAPHDFLFRQAKIVVHHGGAGTTHAASRAGCASVIVPHLADQPYWARCLGRAGIAPAPVAREKLNVRRLSDALRTVLDQPSYLENASAVAARMSEEEGAAGAARLIEEYASGDTDANTDANAGGSES